MLLRTAFLALAPFLPAVAASAQTGTVDGATATYRVTFEASWSATTHPGAFPGGAHFSPLIGGTHSAAVAVWGPGQVATNGIEQMAESGGTTMLRAELNALIATGSVGEIVSGGGIGLSPGQATTTFEVDGDHALVSLVTMIAPSPDWFVGVHDVALLDNGRWVDQLAIPALAYDAGTDSGLAFTSSNANTQPADPIALQDSGPFTGAIPLGIFRFERLASVLVFGANVAGSAAHRSGLPTLGDSVRLGFSDPTGSFPSTSLVVTGLAGFAQPNFFTGLSVPQFGLTLGMNGALLLDGPIQLLPLRTLGANGALLNLTVPNAPGLVGAVFYVQSALYDPLTLRLGATQAVELFVGA